MHFKRFILLCAALAGALCPGLPLHASTVTSNVRLNSVGLRPDLNKRASVLGAASALSFTVNRSSDGAVLYSGVLSSATTATDTGVSVRIANFDALTASGSCYVDVPGIGRSVDVRIAPDAYNQSLVLNLLGFYQQRCGANTVSSWQGQTWGHAACHLNDANLYFYSNGADASNRDASGGWHDAGDYNKYVINAAATLGPMLHAWERHQGALSGLTTSTGASASLPDYLEEIKWELDWMRKMQFSDGKVSDKITVWGSFESYTVAPDQHFDGRYFTTWGTAEVAVFTAVMAAASRIYQPYDSAYAATLLSAATLSYNFLQSVTATVQADISGTPQGNYTHSNDSGDRLWAAAEMWETTGSAAYLTDIEARLSAYGDKFDAWLGWAKLYPLGAAVYALSSRSGRNATLLTQVRSAIVSDANGLVSTANSHGFGRAAGAYYWGANGQIAVFAYALDAAHIINGSSSYLSAIQDQLSWLYGRNQYNRSQVTGEGLNPPLNPHDRDSSNDAVAAPRPGHLVGGGTTATNWQDVTWDASLNEVAINWDGGMTCALAALSEAFGATPTPTPSVTPSPSITPSPTISPTFSASPTVTETPTISPSFTASPSFTVSPTVSESFTASPTYTASPTATISPTYTVSPTPAPAPALAPKVLKALGWPSPARRQSLRLKFDLDGPAASVRYSLYSAAYSLVKEEQVFGSYQQGWNQVLLALPDLPPGLYFGRLSAQGGGQDGEVSRSFKLYLLP